MPNSRRTGVQMLFRALPFIFYSVALGQTCKLQWDSKTDCLNIGSLSGKHVVVPANVTRLGQDGLTLCPLESQQSKIPAVIFVMDQSASMDSAFAGYPAGDPQHWRGDLVRNAIAYLNEQSHGSGWFSYIEFAGDTAQDINPSHEDCIDGVNDGAEYLITQDFLPLSDSIVNIWSKKTTSPVQNRCNTGTNYFAALDKAKRYAAGFDPGDVLADVSIIFVSDGRPNKKTSDTYDPLEVDYVVPGVYPPVHGIFLGGEGTADGDVLADISNRTGGTYNLVDPNDVQGMSNVMNQIIDKISKLSLPDSVTLTVNGVNYPSSRVKNASGAFDIGFPRDIPLVPGNNTIAMSIVYIDSASGLPKSKVTSFTVAVEADEADVGTIAIDSSFSAVCAVGNALVINELETPQLLPGATLAQTPHISLADGSTLDLSLTASAFSGASANVRVTSHRTGDVFTSSLKGVGSKTFEGTLSMVLSNQSVLGTVRSADSTDKVFNVAAFDTLDFLWINPEDIRDTIRASILLYEEPRIAFLDDSLYINQIGSRVWDDAAIGARVSVEYLWLTGDFVGTTALSRVDSSRTFQGVSDFQEILLAEKADRIIVRYRDPVFGIDYRDTAILIFDVPQMPVAWMLDEDGDGRADMLQLTYMDSRPSGQHLPSYKLTWGERNQDSIFFRVDSLNPKLSFDVVEISQNGNMEQWRFPLTTPFPYGHTSGAGNLGAGVLTMSGWFNSRNVDFVIPVVDKVGPVLIDVWVDSEKLNVLHFIASEPLGSGASKNWLISKHGKVAESVRTTEVQEYDEQSEVYTVTLLNSSDNLVFGKDSVRFVPQAQGGPRDMAGNGAAEENPFVEVKGSMPSESQILVAFKQTLVHNDTKVALPPAEEGSSEEDFRVLILDPLTGKYVLASSNEKVNQRFAEAMPSLGLTVTLPQVYGFDQDGQPIDPGSGALAWKTEVLARAMFFDQQGQFVARRSMKLTIDDPSTVSRDGTVNLAMVWEVDPQKGLVSYSGRAVGSGVLIAKVDIEMRSEATTDLDVYDRKGVVDESASVKVGDVLRKKKNFVARLGYLRKK